MHLSSRQRVRRLPAVRRWHSPLCVVDPGPFRSNVRSFVRDIARDFQVVGFDGSPEYHGLVRGVIPPECHLHSCVLGHAISPSLEHIG